jgi:hypothetical protein
MGNDRQQNTSLLPYEPFVQPFHPTLKKLRKITLVIALNKGAVYMYIWEAAPFVLPNL